jgi:hypothetical protein
MLFHTDEYIEREFTKSGWIRRGEGSTVFYERPLSGETIQRMVNPEKTTRSKRRRGMQAVMRYLDKLILSVGGYIFTVGSLILALYRKHVSKR